jgi:cold shock CspA family protein
MNRQDYPELIKTKVDRFDTDTGIGYLSVENTEVWFHCISITDGSRVIEAGKDVAVNLRMGRNGYLEAFRVLKID